MEKLQTYFCHIRSIQPGMTTEANTILSRYYQIQRKADQRSQARTTIRLLESLVRLSQGHARLMMRGEVTVQDAVVAVTLMEASMCGASVITGINPLHTAFPRSPSEEYKTQAKIVLQKLNLFDILTDEMGRLNEQEKLFMSRKTVEPRSPMKEKNGKSRDVPVTKTYFPKKAFKTNLNEDKRISGIEELEENVQKLRSGKQQTLCNMSKKLESNIMAQDLDNTVSNLVDGSLVTNNLNNVKTKKGLKRTLEASASNNENFDTTVQSNTKKVKISKKKLDMSIQLHMNKAGDELLKDLEDFEEGTCTWKPLAAKRKNASLLVKFGAGSNCHADKSKQIEDAQICREPSSQDSSQCTENQSLENEREIQVSVYREDERSFENPDDVDFFEDSSQHLNVSQGHLLLDVNLEENDNISNKCKNDDNGLIDKMCISGGGGDNKIPVCSPSQTPDKLSLALGRSRENEKIFSNSPISSNKSVSSKLKRFAIDLGDAGNSSMEKQNICLANGQEVETVENGNTDVKNKVPMSGNLSVSRNNHSPPVLIFKKPSFFSTQVHRASKSHLFPSVREQLGAGFSSEDLDDADFELDL